MSISPLITFKAGKCSTDFDVSPPSIKPEPEPGFLYVYEEDELYHLCWRPRAASLANPDLDLLAVPTDCTFTPYLGKDNDAKKSPVKGRVFVLKFSSSAARHFFWLQSREQPPGQPRQFSHRDLRLGEIVNDLLQGNPIDPQSEIDELRRGGGGAGGDNDWDMEDAPSGNTSTDRTASGDAGAGASGGDASGAGASSGGSGAGGDRAAVDSAVQSFLNSLKGTQFSGGPQQDKLFTTLAELLPSATTIAMLKDADPQTIEDLLVDHLPAALILQEHGVEDIPEEEPDAETMRASVQALDIGQQRAIVERVLHSPQFSQGLMSLTSALRDGGLPSVAEALGVQLVNGGYTGPDRRAPLTGGAAVEAFLDGMKNKVEKNEG